MNDQSNIETLSLAELRHMVERSRRIFNVQGYGFWEWNLTTDKIEWAGNSWQQFGYTQEDLHLFSTSQGFSTFVHPDDLGATIHAVKKHLKTLAPVSFSYRMRTKDNQYRWMQVKAEAMHDNNGRVLYISGINFDISEFKSIEVALRKSEARQARIIDASNDGIWEWDADREGSHFSSHCWEHLGYAEFDKPNEGRELYREWLNHIHPDDLDMFNQALLDNLSGIRPFDVEYRMFSKRGDIRWIRGRGRAEFNDKGEAVRMSGTNIDITDLKNAEERALQAKEIAEKANLAKSEFLSSMSHELRTPLNAIIGYAQLFEYDDNLKESQKSNVQEILQGGEHLLKLINDVLDLAKIESGNMETLLQATMASRIINECFTLVQPQADVRGIHLFSNFNTQENAFVIADPVHLKQALLNLMSNAIKYNNVGGEVEVVLEHHKTMLRIVVRDTGMGIAESRRNEVFQPFHRLHTEESTVEGTGVGLVITRQLVEMMNGSVDFESQVGVGTKFWLDLPLCDAGDVVEYIEPKPTATSDLPLLNVASHCNILYIEDNPTNVRLLQQFFDRYDNFTLHVAEEPYLGIFKARQHKPNVIILDINLPGLDGYEVLNILQRDSITKHIPVLALSANATPFDIKKGVEAGFYEYLTKPVNIGKMVGVLNELFSA